ncbi:FmdB family transcriptional regulator [Desulfocarbo indianensis]|nr:FmdB family transcriptional regulator [Desulfocarbo indianensis]
MPIYEYECSKCNGVHEAIQKFSDPPLKKCPECGGKLHKIMSMNAFHLKGDGWYVTDYKGKNSSTCKSEDSGSSEPKTEKAEKKEPKKKADKKADK